MAFDQERTPQLAQREKEARGRGPRGREERVVVREQPIVRVEGHRVFAREAVDQVADAEQPDPDSKQPERAGVDPQPAVGEKGPRAAQGLHAATSQSTASRATAAN